MRSSSLSAQIARQILELIQAGELPPGTHLREQSLAARFAVSRSPLRKALKGLAADGTLAHRPNQGFFVDGERAPLRLVSSDLAMNEDEEPYASIAAERLAGNLPERFTAADLGRRFGLSRGAVTRVVGRMMQEGWIERLPGYGFAFLPVLTTPEAFSLGYRFRLAIEPAALLEPTYRIDKAAFALCRAQQSELITRPLSDITPINLFRLGSAFHETIVRCSRNPFLLDALQRINRLRRLIEYRAMVDTRIFLDQAQEHIQILDRIEDGDRRSAAEMLRRHLEAMQTVKLTLLGREVPQHSVDQGCGLAEAKVHF